MDSWGVQITLSLTLEEIGALGPTANWLPPSPATSIFNLSAAGTLSSDATRIEKLNSYYSVQDLLKFRDCDPRNRPGGLSLMQSDLKLKEWLFDVMSTAGTGTVHYSGDTTKGPFGQNVISHEVKFLVVSSGNITPGWKLTRVSVNQTGSLLSFTRNRTHDLTITFGPTSATVVETILNGRITRVVTRGPSEQAAYSHLSSEIGLAVSNGIRSGLQP
jgi:hypothetical protein